METLRMQALDVVDHERPPEQGFYRQSRGNRDGLRGSGEEWLPPSRRGARSGARRSGFETTNMAEKSGSAGREWSW